MSNEKLSQLPTVVSAQLTDIYYAVQGGTSVQESLLQSFQLFQSMLGYSGPGGVLLPSSGGTGVNNSTNTITISGNVTFNGAYTFSGILTGNTTVVFPTSGALFSSTTDILDSVSAIQNSGNTGLSINSSGILNTPNQPKFSAYQSSTLTVTGNGTIYTIIANNVRINESSSYDNTTGIFTAPAAGTYLFGCAIELNAIVGDNTGLIISIEQAGNFSKTFDLFNIGSSGTINDSGSITSSGSIILSMDVGDTVKFKVQVFGHATANVGIADGSSIFGHMIG